MKRIVWIAVLLGVAAVPGLEAQAYDCVPDIGCGQGGRPPSCCKPPPCHFYTHLWFARAMARMLSPDVVAEAVLAADGENQSVLDLLYKTMIPFRRAPFCKVTPGVEHPLPINLFVSDPPDCTIQAGVPGGSRPMTRDEALTENDTCEEFVEADYDRVEAELLFCRTSDPEDNYAGFNDLHVAQMQEADSLQFRLEKYWKVCSTQIDPMTRANLLSAGIDVLEDPPAPKPKLKRKSRAGWS